MLERAKIAAEMKDLDQPSRASLRKYGVRFGAYHIYFPPLLKPAARALASLLWAREAGQCRSLRAVGRAASGELRPHLVPGRQGAAARCLSRARLQAMRRARGARRHSGAARRSDPPGAGLARELAGRKAGRRVRRPRLCGDAGDDLAHRFGRRGFRLGPARARLSHGSPPAIAAEAGAGGSRDRDGASGSAAGGSAAAETMAEVPATEVAAELPVSGDPAPSAALLPEVTPITVTPEDAPGLAEPAPEPPVTPEDAPGIVAEDVEEAQPATPAAVDAPQMPETAEQPSTPEAPAEAVAIEAAPAEAASSESEPAAETAADASAAAPETPVEPQLVEVWRPGGRSEERRPRHDRNRHRRHRPSAAGRAAGGRSGEAVEGGEAKPREHHRRRDAATRIPKRPGEGAPAEAAATAARRRGRARARRQGSAPRALRRQGPRPRRAPPQQVRRRSQGNRGERDRGREFGRDKGRDKRDRESGPSHRQYATSAQPARARSSGRSEFAVRQARRAEGAARGQPQGLNKAFSSEVGTGSRQENASNKGLAEARWTASVSTNGCGMRGW